MNKEFYILLKIYTQYLTKTKDYNLKKNVNLHIYWPLIVHGKIKKLFIHKGKTIYKALFNIDLTSLPS